jgi:hypothetical protein
MKARSFSRTGGRTRAVSWSLLALFLAGIGSGTSHGTRPPALEEREIVWQEAQQGGASFPEPTLADSSAGCRATTGVARSGGMLFSLHCPGALGTKSIHPALVGLRLKNGWRVKGTRVVTVGQSKAGFYLEKPAPGSDEPLLRGRLWTGPGGDVLVEVYVKVEGPKDASYFR